MKLKMMLVGSTAVLALMAASGSDASPALEPDATAFLAQDGQVASAPAVKSGEVTAKPVPEPNTAFIGAVGLLLLFRRRSID